MKQLLLPVQITDGQQFSLTGPEHHYLSRVLRLSSGSRLEVMDSAGRKHACRIKSVSPDSLSLVQEALISEPDSGLTIRVYQAIPKAKKMDSVIRDLTQLGVTRISPIVTERTVAKPSDGTNKMERWSRVAKEAVQQSGARPVIIDAPVSLGQTDPFAHELSLLLHPRPLVSESLHGYLGQTSTDISIWTGPEGGFADNEVEWLRERGCLPLWLGPRVLRTELAAVAAISALRLLLLERGEWQLKR